MKTKLKQMIAVMQEYSSGGRIQILRPGDPWVDWDRYRAPHWNWFKYDYRIKPREPREWWINGKLGHMDEHVSVEGLRISNGPIPGWVRVREVIE